MHTNATKRLHEDLSSGGDKPDFELQAGDCGIIIRKDGTTNLFQYGIDAEALKQPPETLNEEQLQSLLNGQLLMVLSVVAGTPMLQQSILSSMIAQGHLQVPAANSNAH
jgi:hypothetical protein